MGNNRLSENEKEHQMNETVEYKIAPKHIEEEARIAALKSYDILDTLPDSDYDNLTYLASQICGTPIALMSLIDENRQWFKSKVGVDALETHRDLAFCAHAINDQTQPLIVEDARKDERFAKNPLVTGETKVIFYAGVPLVNKENLPLGTLCVIDNEPKELNDEQIRALEVLSEQAIHLLEYRKKSIELRTALDEIQESNKKLEQFAQKAAHDLKSPLTTNMLLSEIVNTEYGHLLPEEGRMMLSKISKGNIRLGNLISGHLDFSRGANSTKYKKEKVSLRALIKQLNTSLSLKQEFDIELDAFPNNIKIQKNALERIFLNLFTNSIKYCDKDQVKIKVETTEEKKFYHFTVSDNGPGIPIEHRDKVFSMYETLQEKDKFGEASTGIGLASVKNIIETLKGDIQIDCNEMGGCVIKFSLPK